MAVIEGGTTGALVDVDSNFKAIHVVERPLDPANGAYGLSIVTGTIAASIAANSVLFTFRWTDATRLCVIQKIVTDGVMGGTTGFTAGIMRLESVVARSFTTSPATGTAVSMTTNNNKMRTSHSSSLVGDIHIASTGAITAPTYTLDGNAFGAVMGVCSATANLQIIPGDQSFYDASDGNMHPLVLAQNEGFIIRAALVPATGTWTAGFSVRWTELNSY